MPKIYNKLQFIFRENLLGSISTKEASCRVLIWKYICLKNPGLPTNKAMKGLTTSFTTWCLMVYQISKVSCHLRNYIYIHIYIILHVLSYTNELFWKVCLNFREMSTVKRHQELPLRFSRKGKDSLLKTFKFNIASSWHYQWHNDLMTLTYFDIS